MESALISCIVPVYNGERYIKEAVDSILAQTYRPLEIIVVDDGSNDKTAEIVSAYGNRLRYSHQLNAGPAAARNLGLNTAAGDFVAFLDADDLWHREKLERQMVRFKARAELDLCVTHVQNFWIAELADEEARFRDHPFSRPLPGYAPQTLMARRLLFERVGQFDTTLRAAEDTDWFLRAAEYGVVMELLPEVLVCRRLHHANLSRSAAASNAMLKVIKSSLNRRRISGDGGLSTYTFPTSDRGAKP